MADRPDELAEQIRILLDQGDDSIDEDRFEEALSRFRTAWDLLPEPRMEHPSAMLVLAAIGDAHFFRRDFAAGRETFITAMRCVDGEPVGNPFLRLRLGQCLFELGELEDAANWLSGAYLMEGTMLFDQDDPKYLAFVKARLEPPPGGWPEGW